MRARHGRRDQPGKQRKQQTRTAARARRKTMQIQKERPKRSHLTQTEERQDEVSGALRCVNDFLS